ncbi:MAG: sugar phosphate isomerase/epimerase [Treponema sp.]|nr:sugar phosphate isomerase/epimerase [Treponema sp.]
MEYGIISREIPAGSIAELFNKTRDYGFTLMQLNYASFLEKEMPESIPDSVNREIAAEAAANRIKIAAVNGTFNMAHPDAAVRQDGVKRFEKIAASCKTLGCELVSLCTGSRNAGYMWAPHPENNGPQAWNDMSAVMEQLVEIAEKYDVNLGIETEASNVINTPVKAKKLIDQIKSLHLKIIMDAANLFLPGTAKRENVKPVIARAFDLLGPYIALAHGKDIKEGNGIEFTHAGAGIIDFGFFINELEKIGYKGGMILHGFKKQEEIIGSKEFIRTLPII